MFKAISELLLNVWFGFSFLEENNNHMCQNHGLFDYLPGE